MAGTLITGQESVSYILQGAVSFLSSSTVQASPAPTTSQFSVASGKGATFEIGTVYIGSEAGYLSAISGDALIINPPLTAVPSVGATVSQQEQHSTLTGATTTGNGFAAPTGPLNGSQRIEIINLSTGSATVIIEGSEGSVDGTGTQLWYPAEYLKLADNTGANVNRTTYGYTAITAGANTAQVFQVTDLYLSTRARIATLTAPASIVVKLNGVII